MEKQPSDNMYSVRATTARQRVLLMVLTIALTALVVFSSHPSSVEVIGLVLILEAAVKMEYAENKREKSVVITQEEHHRPSDNMYSVQLPVRLGLTQLKPLAVIPIIDC